MAILQVSSGRCPEFVSSPPSALPYIYNRLPILGCFAIYTVEIGIHFVYNVVREYGWSTVFILLDIPEKTDTEEEETS